MAETQFAPSETTRTDVQIGAVVTDQRTGDHRRVVYADSRVVLTRDEAGSTTLTARDSFEAELGTRYRVSPVADPDVDGGQYERLRGKLAEYDAQDGRKAKHKADALREALDLLAGEAPAGSDGDAVADGDGPAGRGGDGNTGSGKDTDTNSGDESDKASGGREIAFESIDGIGPETAGNLRSRGIVTVADVRAASDEVLGSIAGVGPGTLEKIREFVD